MSNIGGPAGHLLHPGHHPGHPQLELCWEQPEEDGQETYNSQPLGNAEASPSWSWQTLSWRTNIRETGYHRPGKKSKI